MKVRCVRPHGRSKPGDVAEVPDGAQVAADYWEPVPDSKPAPAPAAAETPKAGA